MFFLLKRQKKGTRAAQKAFSQGFWQALVPRFDRHLHGSRTTQVRLASDTCTEQMYCKCPSRAVQASIRQAATEPETKGNYASAGRLQPPEGRLRQVVGRRGIRWTVRHSVRPRQGHAYPENREPTETLGQDGWKFCRIIFSYWKKVFNLAAHLENTEGLWKERKYIWNIF